MVEPAKKLSEKIPDDIINKWAAQLLKSVKADQGLDTKVKFYIYFKNMLQFSVFKIIRD